MAAEPPEGKCSWEGLRNTGMARSAWVPLACILTHLCLTLTFFLLEI